VDAILVDTGTDIPAQITALNDFDPATDTVANVTTVGSVTGLNASLLDAAITTRSTFDPATNTVTNVTNVANVNGAVQSDLRSVEGVALATHTAGKVPADATATVSGTVDANLIEVDGVALVSHVAGKVPADGTFSPTGEIAGTVSAGSHTPNSCGTNLVALGFTSDDIFKNRTIEFLSGSLEGALAYIHGYDGTTGVLKFSSTPNSIAPSSGDTFRLL
jgi:hypothetical protein